MLIGGEWQLSQQNLITFVMVDAAGNNLPGLGAAFVMVIRKAGGAFNPSAGVKAEIANGWYSYLASAVEADTPGPVSIYVTGVGAAEQNLEYIVETRAVSAIQFTYTVTNIVTGAPIDGVEVWFTTDIAGANIVWSGNSDTFGIARDDDDKLPRLDAGTYYIWRQKAGFTFVDPDVEVVS